MKSTNTQFFVLRDRESLENIDIYILAQVSSNKFSLISLTDGNRWNDPIKVKDCMAHTKEETAAIFHHCPSVIWAPAEFSTNIKQELDKINGYK